MTGKSVHRLPCSVAESEEVFVVGDVHGCADRLDGLLALAAAMPREAPRRVLVTLGDVIDRGPDSLGAVRLTRAAGARIGADLQVGLMGNHEMFARIALDDDLPHRARMSAQTNWMVNGGARVVEEIAETGVEDVEASLRTELGTWLEGLVPSHASGGVTFVHAGLDPHAGSLKEALSATWRADFSRGFDENRHWAWVREPFLRRDAGPHHGRFVVHGHSPAGRVDRTDAAVQVARWRLNLDGGSYGTGRVRMARLVGDEATVFES